MKITILLFALFCVSSSHQLDWQNGQPGIWALNCDFVGNDLAKVLSKGPECSLKCSLNIACSHFTCTFYACSHFTLAHILRFHILHFTTNLNGGTCWLKSGSISKERAGNKQGAICGIISETTGILI